MVYVQLMDLFIFSKCYVSIVFNFISSYLWFDLKLTKYVTFITSQDDIEDLW